MPTLRRRQCATPGGVSWRRLSRSRNTAWFEHCACREVTAHDCGIGACGVNRGDCRGERSACCTCRCRGLLAQRNLLPSLHLRCGMAASLRATATRPRAMPGTWQCSCPARAHRRPFRAAEQRMGCLIECYTSQLISAPVVAALQAQENRWAVFRRPSSHGSGTSVGLSPVTFRMRSAAE